MTLPVGGNSVPAYDLFLALTIREGLSALREAEWRTERVPGRVFERRHYLYDSPRRKLLRLGRALLFFEVRGPTIDASAAAPTVREAECLLANLRDRIPSVATDPGTTATVRFWNQGPNMATRRSRSIDISPWESIAQNYAASIREPLDALMRRTEPPSSGRLVLWYGPPGTGKTYLIRALAHAWRDWCITDYVIDCDALLHGGSEYLTSLLLDAPLSEDRWRLVVLEDAGEYLMPDAAASKGQGFSRLLNTLDGMVGQVTKAMVLVTTNRDVGLLDPAISRPGRCAMALEVPPLAPSEAATWLADRGHAVPVGAEATLAELYATLRGEDPPAPRRRLGFGG